MCYWVGEWYSLVKSLDGGTSWSSVYPPMGPIIAIAVSPSNTSTVYASKGDKLIRTRDGGQSWLSLASVGKAYDVSSLIVHPTDSDTVYAVTERYGVYKSTDGGGSWMSLNQTLPNQGVDLQCPALAIHPMRPELVFLACNMYGIFYSMDAGLTWSLLGSGFNPFLRINSLAVAPISGQVSFHPTLRLVDQPYPYPEPYSVYLPLVMKAASPPFIVYVGTEAGVWRLVGP